MSLEDKLKKSFSSKRKDSLLRDEKEVESTPFPLTKNIEPVNETPVNLHTYVPTDVAIEEQTNIATNNRLKLYLNIYSFKAMKEEITRGRFRATNVEISDELRLAMDKLIAIHLDGVVANDTDKSYKEIINNALFEYLNKQYKRLENS